MATNNMANINVSILPNYFRGAWIENNQLQIVSDTYDMILYYIRAVSKRSTISRWLQYLKNQMYFSNWYVLLNLLVDKNGSSYVIADAYNDGYIKFFYNYIE